ncbi:hypothetical protein BpHYR1_046784 [Brachionus plicatilis]|uniref:Uncharacterized protein n=1 Tax=Brachionus plicatilis TaxID=10195 RepID=A0A3M7SAD7_BRAPC|nr:hypothetical protein BpHYR1_046784 [Brachionus plicatilis]
MCVFECSYVYRITFIQTAYKFVSFSENNIKKYRKLYLKCSYIVTLTRLKRVEKIFISKILNLSKVYS